MGWILCVDRQWVSVLDVACCEVYNPWPRSQGPAGWSRGSHTRLEAVSPGFESRPTYKLSSQCLTGRVIHQRCVPSLGWTLNGNPVCQHLLVDIKDPMVSFMKSRPAIAGTMNEIQIPALTACVWVATRLGLKPESYKLLRQLRLDAMYRAWFMILSHDQSQRYY